VFITLTLLQLDAIVYIDRYMHVHTG